MNLKQLSIIILLAASNFSYLFAAAASSSDKPKNELTLGTLYDLPTLPAQDNPFTPPQETEKSLTNLWGLLLPTTTQETPRNHILKILASGQMHAACTLTSATTTLKTSDPNFLELLPIILDQELIELRKISHEKVLECCEKNRKKSTEIIANIHLLLAAIQSSVATQATLTPKKKHLYAQALDETVKKQTDFFELLSKEHAVLIAVLEKIKEKVELK